MQAFGLMVTAEPYYSVTMPSDVVVAENLVRPDTIGAREAVTAKYELMPRGQYTLNLQPAERRSVDAGARLSFDRYEAVLELYQAENAIQIAHSLGADRFAPDTFKSDGIAIASPGSERAQGGCTYCVSDAREAAQMAEDARSIAVKRRDEQRHADEIQRSQNQGELRRRAEDDAAQARAEADAQAHRPLKRGSRRRPRRPRLEPPGQATIRP